MLPIQERLQQVPWADLKHAYGEAKDTPIWLFALLGEEAEAREQALDQLWASICHQGSVYEASCAAVPFLIEILEQVPDERKVPILGLLRGLAHVSWYANRGRRFLKIDRSMRSPHGKSQYWTSWGKFLEVGNVYHETQWMKLGHQLVGNSVDTYLALLQLDSDEVVTATLDLLAGFKEKNTQLIPYAFPLAFRSESLSIRVSALHSLAALLDIGAPEWEHYRLLASADPLQVPEQIRFAAAYALAWYYPEGACELSIRPLVEAMFKPDGSLKKAMQALSQLGVPLGLQGLLEGFERGNTSWDILDTMRVAEALLDVAFFGGWVDGRYWSRQAPPPVSLQKVIPGYPAPFEEEEKEERKASFFWEYSTSWSGSDTFVEYQINCFGYDDNEATKLQQRFEREGKAAFSKEQIKSIRTILRCGPFWETKNNLLAIYGLPVTRPELENLLANEGLPEKS